MARIKMDSLYKPNDDNDIVLAYNLYYTETDTTISIGIQLLICDPGTVTVKIGGTTRFTKSTSTRIAADNTSYAVYTINKTTSPVNSTFAVSHSATNETSSGSWVIPTKTQYAIKYKASVGNPPSGQIKFYGDSIQLSSALTVDGYTFIGWNTEEDWSGTEYAAGASYSDNAPLTLYAMLAMNPKVTKADAYRCEYSSPAVVSDEGQYAAVSFTLSRSEVITRCQYTAAVYSDMECTQLITGTSVSGSYSSAQEGTGSSTVSLNITKLLASSTSATKLNTDSKYYVKITSSGKYSNNGTLVDTTSNTYIDEVPEAFFTMDVRAGGHGIAFGGPSNEDAFLNYFRSRFFADVMFETMTGTIQMFGGDTPPNGWLLCDGSYVSKTKYSKLYEVIGDIWGFPSSDKFALPNFKSRMPIGANTLATNQVTTNHYSIAHLTHEEEYLAYVLECIARFNSGNQEVWCLHLFDVKIALWAYSGSTFYVEPTIGVYLNGGSTNVGTIPTSSFQRTDEKMIFGGSDNSSYYYVADHVQITMTLPADSSTEPLEYDYLFLYNTPGKGSLADAECYMHVGNFYLEYLGNAGDTDSPLSDFTEIDFSGNLYIGRNGIGEYGGYEAMRIDSQDMPSHTHGLNNHTHSISHQHGFGFASGQSIVTSNKGISEHKVASGSSTSNTYLYSDGDVQTSGKTATTTITTSTSGGNTGSTTASGGGKPKKYMPPYAVVNFIICTGILE